MSRPDLTFRESSRHQSGGMASVLDRNIRVMDLRREQDEHRASREERFADAITRFAGSMWSVYLHLLLFGFWIVANLGWLSFVPPWDESLVILAMFASVEAIFLSTFVLISQNRMGEAAQRRADLDLQINLLAEHEVTRLVALVSAMAKKLDVETEIDTDVEELKKDVEPDAVLDHIEAVEERAPEAPSSVAGGL